jgi:hypothetical protein
MRTLSGILVALALALLLGLLPGTAQAQAPVLLFTDIVTGANSGGENGNGVYITIYGKNFGATQGSSTVTVGGVAAVQYKIWGSQNGINPALDKVVVQIGPNNKSGNIVMTVNGQQSNALPFTVCSGHIYFVSPSGSDSAAGTFSAPWLTPTHARATMAAGDTVYFRAGIYNTQDQFGSIIYCVGACTGTATAYQNFLGYPGETAQLGDSSTSRAAIYNWGNGVVQYMTVGELTLRGQSYGMTCQNTSGGAQCNYLRIVGNDMRALGGGSTAFDIEMPATNDVIYGNDSSYNCQGSSGCSYDNRSYSIYLGGYGAQSNIDIGWNALHDNPYGKGIQIYGHIAGDTISGLKIHDNAVYNNTMTGMTLGGSDGGTEFVQDALIYNNLIWNNSNGVGTDHMNYGGIQIQSLGTSVGTYQIYNNTFYNDSPAHSGVQPGGVISFGLEGTYSTIVRDNILYATANAPCYLYFDDSSSGSRMNVTFSNNLYYGAGTGPNGCNWNVGSLSVNSDANAVNGDPQFVSASAANFHLNSTSPAINAGMNTGVAMDYDGYARPQGTAYTIGAYEYASGTSTGQVLPPTNVHVVSVQ